MSKKILFVGGIFLLGILVVGGGFYLKWKKTFLTQPSETLENLFPQEPITEERLLYEDEAGFSFQYPASLGIVEKEVNNPKVYSSLELLSKNHPGEKLVVRIKDTSLATLEKWLEQNPLVGELQSSEETTLAGMKGKSFRFTNPSESLILVINSGILYHLQAPSDEDFWDQALKTVSFTFKLTTGETAGEQPGAPIIEEEEEIIQ